MTPDEVDPRVARTRDLVLGATAELLVEQGFDRVTIEEIADRSRVARSTIYRNWPDRSELLVEGFDRLCSFSEVPDLGGLEPELRLLAQDLADGLTEQEWGCALASFVGSAAHDPELAAAKQAFSERRRAMVGAVFERAAARGEISDRWDPGELAELFAAPFFFRRLISHAPIDEAFVERQVRLIAAVATD